MSIIRATARRQKAQLVISAGISAPRILLLPSVLMLMGQAGKRLNTLPHGGSKGICFLINGNTRMPGRPAEFYMSKLKGPIYLYSQELHKRVLTLSKGREGFESTLKVNEKNCLNYITVYYIVDG